MTEVNDLTDEQFEEICAKTIRNNLDSSKLTREAVEDMSKKLADTKPPKPYTVTGEIRGIVTKGELNRKGEPVKSLEDVEKIINDNGYQPENIIVDEMTGVNDLTDEQFEEICENTVSQCKGIELEVFEEISSKSEEPLIPDPIILKKAEFIDKEAYNELRSDWENIWPEKKAKVYQEYDRVAPRCGFFVKHGLPYLRGRHVLEIGANAGLQGFHIDMVSSSYVGVEPGNKISRNPNPKTDYFLQAKKTEERMSDDAKFVNMTINEFIENRGQFKYDAFFASFALYHFTDQELNLLKEYVFPECDVVVIQTRHQKRPTKHNKWKFWKPSQVERFFGRLGFNCHTMNQVEPGEYKNRRPKKHNGFSLQICTRPEYQK